MKPPCPFKIGKNDGWSLCVACDKWQKTLAFFHKGSWLALCYDCWVDYWDGTDKLESDYRPPVFVTLEKMKKEMR